MLNIFCIYWKRLVCAIPIIILLLTNSPVCAQQKNVVSGKTAVMMVAFYASIKGIQVVALNGASDMWRALGSATNAAHCLSLAADLEKGDLANDDGMKKFKVANKQLRETIEDLTNSGIPISRAQQQAADAAKLKVAGTAALWIAAGVSVVKLVTSRDLSTVEKVLIGALMAGEVASAASATSDLVSAYNAYASASNDATLVFAPSEELSKHFLDL